MVIKGAYSELILELSSIWQSILSINCHCQYAYINIIDNQYTVLNVINNTNIIQDIMLVI